MLSTFLRRTLVPVTFCLVFIGSYSQNNNKDEKQKEAIKNMIDQKTFIFEAQTVTPMKGGIRYLDPGYTLKVKPDTLISELPYFGRAYQAEYGATDGGLKATSYQYDYAVKDRKNGGWDIVIKTRDLKDQLQLTITAFDDGTASLNVNSSNRQPISFRGFFQTKK